MQIPDMWKSISSDERAVWSSKGMHRAGQEHDGQADRQARTAKNETPADKMSEGQQQLDLLLQLRHTQSALCEERASKQSLETALVDARNEVTNAHAKLADAEAEQRKLRVELAEARTQAAASKRKLQAVCGQLEETGCKLRRLQHIVSGIHHLSAPVHCLSRHVERATGVSQDHSRCWQHLQNDRHCGLIQNNTVHRAAGAGQGWLRALIPTHRSRIPTMLAVLLCTAARPCSLKIEVPAFHPPRLACGASSPQPSARQAGSESITPPFIFPRGRAM
jgi:hypothetical protein